MTWSALPLHPFLLRAHSACPRGDAVDCPANWGCYASTLCTLHPTAHPTTTPTKTPSGTPTLEPTKAPWGQVRFEDFLYGPSDTGGELSPSSDGEIASNDKEAELAAEVNEQLENYETFQYHFACGRSWDDADNTCEVFCPSGDKSECPYGQECYANT